MPPHGAHVSCFSNLCGSWFPATVLKTRASAQYCAQGQAQLRLEVRPRFLRLVPLGLRWKRSVLLLSRPFVGFKKIAKTKSPEWNFERKATVVKVWIRKQTKKSQVSRNVKTIGGCHFLIFFQILWNNVNNNRSIQSFGLWNLALI